MMALPPDVLHERRALAAWRERYSLINRLHELYRRAPERALVLTGYIQRYYGSAWDGLVVDVAMWPNPLSSTNGSTRPSPGRPTTTPTGNNPGWHRG